MSAQVTMATTGPTNKAERLALAGAVAPSLRGASAKAKTRRIAVVGKDGSVTRYTTVADVQKKLLEAQKLEIAVDDGVRPKAAVCGLCGRVVPVAKSGPPRPVRHKCSRDACSVPGCAGFAHRDAAVAAARRGKPVRCSAHRAATMVICSVSGCGAQVPKHVEYYYKRKQRPVVCPLCRKKACALSPGLSRRECCEFPLCANTVPYHTGYYYRSRGRAVVCRSHSRTVVPVAQ